MKAIPHFFLFIYYPLYQRILKGEGGLIIFNISHSWMIHGLEKNFFFESFLSVLIMCLLYGFNDYSDRVYDLSNPKKPQHFIEKISSHATFFIIQNILLSALCILIGFYFLGFTKGLVLLFLFLANMLYSKKLKSTPVFDILIVIVWGALYVTFIGQLDWLIYFTVGIMTGIAHLYQTLTDEVSDRASNIKTSAVSLPHLKFYILLAHCVLLAVLIYIPLDIYWAFSAFLPLLVYLLTKRISISWHFSRFYFAICWLQLLYLQYGN